MLLCFLFQNMVEKIKASYNNMKWREPINARKEIRENNSTSQYVWNYSGGVNEDPTEHLLDAIPLQPTTTKLAPSQVLLDFLPSILLGVVESSV